MRHSDWLALAWSIVLLVGFAASCVERPPPIRAMAESVELGMPLSWAVSRWYVATGADVTRLKDVSVRYGECTKPNHIGCYRVVDGARSITVAVQPLDLRTEWILVHEVGHALGADHHTGRGVLRTNEGAATSCLTADDLALVCESTACQWRVPEC